MKTNKLNGIKENYLIVQTLYEMDLHPIELLEILVELLSIPERVLTPKDDPENKDLWGLFVWGDTPQGHRYWSALAHKMDLHLFLKNK